MFFNEKFVIDIDRPQIARTVGVNIISSSQRLMLNLCLITHFCDVQFSNNTFLHCPSYNYLHFIYFVWRITVFSFFLLPYQFIVLEDPI